MSTRFTLNQATPNKVFNLKETPLNATGNTITFSIADDSVFDTSKLKIRLYDDADNTNYANNYKTNLSVAGIAQPQAVQIVQPIGGISLLNLPEQGFIEFYLENSSENDIVNVWCDNLNDNAVVE
jgi:hypothetical protein